MFGWLKSLLGIGAKRESIPGGESAPRKAMPPEAKVREPEPAAEKAEAEPGTVLPEAAQGFLRTLIDPPELPDLQTLPPDDRLFISGMLKRIRERQLQIPVLPQAALEISQLLGNPNADASAFAKVLEADPALSVDVLRIANSAYYGFQKVTTSVRDAVVRIGVGQLRGLVIVTHLQGKILQGGAFRDEAGWISDLSLSLANVAQNLARELGLDRDAAFTRGVLHHVEHFVIMGSVAEISKEHKRRLQLSQASLHYLFSASGAKVRALAAQGWQLESLLLDAPEEGRDVGSIYRTLRKALVSRWLGESYRAELPGISEERLRAAMASVGVSSAPTEDSPS